ncbi:MAG: hypothetical protein ACYC6Y_00220, partial [Thermoguttaceae bacterium]
MEHIVSKKKDRLRDLDAENRIVRRSASRCIWAFLFSLVLVTFAGCGGCRPSEPSADPSAPWGGMGSREAYMAWKEEQQRKEIEEEAAGKKAAELPPPAPGSSKTEGQLAKQAEATSKPIAAGNAVENANSSAERTLDQD